jgi:hypothetical protein
MENNQEIKEDLTAESQNIAGADENAESLEKTNEEAKEKAKITFTKEQQKFVDDLIQKRLSREKEKVNKGEVNKDEDLLSKFNELSNEFNKSKRENALMKAKIPEEFRDYVEYKVLKNVNEDTDFETALQEFIADEKNAKYSKEVSASKDIVKPVNMPRPVNSGNNADDKAIKQKLLQEMYGN